MTGTRTGETTCADGTVIAHLTAGNGPPLVMLPGWSQTAQIFTGQLKSFSESWRVFAIDHRGHGASSVPEVGYHIHRLAADLHDVLSANDLDDVRLLGHSMGCAVIWSYLELFGRERLAALILVDQMPCALRDPAWTDETALQAGATMDAAGLFAFTGQLRSDDHDPRIDFLTEVTSPGFGRDDLAWLIEQGVRFDRRLAADLLFDVATHDWRALIPHIGLPTLVVAGDSVNVPIASQRWVSRQIPGARFARVAARDGGTHFPFLENRELFDAELANFLVTTSAN
ncbi:alpha/beta hydrolase [Mycobacterium sp. CVI_P3]|uniref:Alpha/beta hydrolase n=1 Tax=Mycobacterium pinniadriaticum TaxID=2994102 RepID=A0ABT3SP89_9MYCO|nr:alpha/beta hydrolase [Mycobacterium pinniadriaticum]MCX2934536.1 alpha/beta hydrolase [Mycobacterium pinniadriaticum]MCX2940959.1 alpha/beta hydrolase [Mycobacterium pinniadriaticum]